MKPVKNHARKLAWTLTLAVAALMLPASVAHAQHGTSGGHAALGSSGFSTHQGHHPYYGGYGFGVGGYYPGWGSWLVLRRLSWLWRLGWRSGR